MIANGLHALLQPAALLRILQVHVFHADRAAIGFLQGLDNVLEGRHPVGGKAPREKGRFQIIDRQSESTQRQQGVVDGAGFQGVHAGQEMPHVAISVLQRFHARLAQHMVFIPGTLVGHARRAAHVKTFEKMLPVRADGLRIFPPATVLVLDEVGVIGLKGIHGQCSS